MLPVWPLTWPLPTPKRCDYKEIMASQQMGIGPVRVPVEVPAWEVQPGDWIKREGGMWRVERVHALHPPPGPTTVLYRPVAYLYCFPALPGMPEGTSLNVSAWQSVTVYRKAEGETCSR
jgi:hypothetical protein